MREPKKEPYLTPQEVAVILRVHVGTLANWRTTGYGPKFVKFGKKVLYAEREINRFEKNSERESTAPVPVER